MIVSFQELKSEEHVSNLVFCLNYFDYSQSVGRWVSEEAATRGVLNLKKFTGKHLCQSLLFSKVAGLGLQLY